MSVVRLDSPSASLTDRPVSGGQMDRVVERRGPPRWLVIAGLVVLTALGLAGAAIWLMPRAGDQTVAASRLTISPVTRGVFEDFLPLRARVTPLVTVYLDAVEGGRVEKRLVEDGATVAKGQLLAVLSNAELQLSTLARQTEVEQQLNNMRSQELALAQSRVKNERDIVQAELDLAKVERLYRMQEPLAAKGFVPGKVFNDTKDEREADRRRLAAIREGAAVDEKLQAAQLAELRASAASLRSSLAIARASLDQLNLRAPVAGQLTAFEAEVGQSLSRGERIGQIDSPGRNKVVAGVDEFYLGRVLLGQRATVEWAGKRYGLKVRKISPQVNNGQFEIDLVFTDGEPDGVQRGQTLQARLTLGDPAPALLLPAGAWYNDTGGAWVFVVAPDGRSAERRSVRLGRRNADQVEVLDGLETGERVITSPYTGMTDKTRLDLDQDARS